MDNDSDRRPRISHRTVVGTVAALIVAFSIAAGLVSHDQVAAQVNPPQRRDRQGGVPENFAERTARALNDFSVEGRLGSLASQAFTSAHESTIQFKNLDGSPVSITGASGRFLKISDVSAGVTVGYVVRPNLRLLNNTDRRLTAVGLEYENADGSVAFYYVERLSSLVEPLAPFTLNNRAATLDGDPSSVVAKVTGVVFEDGRSWGDVPPHPN